MPLCDVTVCLGVTPYIHYSKIDKFLKNTPIQSKLTLINFQNTNNFFNQIRFFLKFLNVRRINFYNKLFLNQFYKKNNLVLKQRINLGTGFADIIFYKSYKR